MPSINPSTPEEILKTAAWDPEFAKAWEAMPLPPGKDYTIEAIKQLTAAGLPNRQKALAASRPADITEYETHLPVRDGWQSRTIIVHPKTPQSNSPSPLIVILYGGGHMVGNPESEISLARRLATAYNAVIALPSYRLAPEHPYPYSINDSWDCVQALAAETHASKLPQSTILPSFTDPSSGFVIGGTSAGCNLSGTIAHLARDLPLSPPLTGQYLCAGSFISPFHVPATYQPFYLSREQNKNAPILDHDLHMLFRKAHKPDFASPIAYSFDQHHPDDKDGGVAKGHMGLPPAYFQACGMDPTRDDVLIYERVLREECGIATRLDLYEGLPHCWWGVYADLESTKRRMEESVVGVGWLLDEGRRWIGKKENGA